MTYVSLSLFSSRCMVAAATAAAAVWKHMFLCRREEELDAVKMS